MKPGSDSGGFSANSNLPNDTRRGSLEPAIANRELQALEPPVSRILFPCMAGTAIIHLVPGSLRGSSGLPKSVGRAALKSLAGSLFYLTLLRVGFALPSLLPGTRCALTAPFHPYPANARRYIFCGTFRRVAPPSRYEAHCPVEFGLSSTFSGRDCLAGSSALIVGYDKSTFQR